LALSFCCDKTWSGTVDEPRRLSDRVTLTVPIQVVGADTMGTHFFREGTTVAVSRNGATILLDRKLGPEQEVVIRSLKSNKENEARIVGIIGQQGDEFIYGVTLLNVPPDFWDVEFSAVSANDDSVIRVLLSCSACIRREIVHLNEVEFQVLEQSGNIYRHCKLCLTTTCWRNDTSSPVQPPSEAINTELGTRLIRTESRRKHNRIGPQLSACIRQLGSSPNIAICEDISRGGLRFLSHSPYETFSELEIAIPYSPNGGGNIFVPIRIMHVGAYGDLFRHGAAFMRGSLY
jgi:hypothetical protein